MSVTVTQAYRFALDPTPAQERDLLRHAGAARVAFKRAGRAMGFARFRSRRRGTPSLRFTTGAIRVAADRHHVTLPRLGTIKTHESTRKLTRRVETGTARILSATVRREAGRWFVAFTCQVERAERTPSRPGAVVGVDIGVTHLAVLSTGELIANPKHLASAARRLRHMARAVSRKAGPDRRSGQRPSKRWEAARADLARTHARVANLRRDGLHKLTTRLAREYGTVVVEDLHVAGMLRNRRLAKAISDCGFGEIRRQLAYLQRFSRAVTGVGWLPPDGRKTPPTRALPPPAPGNPAR